ncbi:MAG: hypothetical protein DI628_05720 [Blastochloris viridis]|uniref:Uncharacterized protein n=1 Tax=Blastochloris viridis TaxID=1079 RepID=A0A6N4R383_BLAVI|nr:MAG: hypothetical protein DI628_05720 [Blastochloris viridis]
MKIKAYSSRYDMTFGENPTVLINADSAEDWFGREPFESSNSQKLHQGISQNLLMDPDGTTDGHNLMRDSTFMDSMRVDKYVPLSPLFVKDLSGRTVYIGYGPERKGNFEWDAYFVDVEKVSKDELNPFIPLVTFPRFCRDATTMEGEELLEQVFLTKFRCLEMSMGFNGKISGSDEDDPLVSASYLGANLYPYKLRLDTFYIDGFRLPQTQMVYARGMQDGVSPVQARKLGQKFLQQWAERAVDTSYEDWFEKLGESRIDDLFMSGCTVIPTFEACNGYYVVGPNFELVDFWPGRAVSGLHDVIESRADKSPAGTILDVLEPGFVTADYVKPALVIVSDGTGYVSPNASDPDPLVPNLNLPHQRVVADWRATWLPTHPLHFEVPALWGWDIDTGRFMQIFGPLWDPLHYYYESVDKVLAAFNKTPLNENRNGLVPVPEDMDQHFYPIIPMTGFDTFSEAEYIRRSNENLLPRSCIKRITSNEYSAGLGYHPMPAEFEFELDPFWFPDMHPLNRDHGIAPEDVNNRISPVINPQITVNVFKPTVDAPPEVTWMADDTKLMTPLADPLTNYPQLTRYLLPDTDIDIIMNLCPMPYLGAPDEELLNKPARLWWRDEDDKQFDDPHVLEDVVPGVHDALWDMREQGVALVKFRHLVYRTNLPLYMLAWWYGWGVQQLELAMEDWVQGSQEEDREYLEEIRYSLQQSS